MPALLRAPLYILYSSEVFLYSICLLVLHKTVPLQDYNTVFTRAIHTHNGRESKESYQNHEWLKYILGPIKPPSMAIEGLLSSCCCSYCNCYCHCHYCYRSAMIAIAVASTSIILLSLVFILLPLLLYCICHCY